MDARIVHTPWKDPEDLLDRGKYAVFLTGYLSSKERPFVLNLNANWGMGKTYFLSHWKESIKSLHPTVYVNAWETDFSDDPLLAVISDIHQQLSDYLPAEQKSVDKFIKYVKGGGRFVRSLAPVIARGLVHKALGEEAGKEALDTLSMAADDLAKVAEKSIGLLLKDHVEKKHSIKEFKESLKILVKDVTERELKPPLFLFIDEMDRCRPTYAIELLEIVKHLFSVDGIVFIFATDSDQLQHSVRAIYGNDFDGGEYLRRFFDQEYILPLPDYGSYCRALAVDFPHSEKLEFGNFKPWVINNSSIGNMDEWGAKDSLSTFLSIFAQNYELSLRSIKQVITRLDAILGSSKKQWDGPFLLFLLVIQAKYRWIISWLRDKCKKNKLQDNPEELMERLRKGGAKVKWQVSSYDTNANKDYSTADIALTYLRAIAMTEGATDLELHKRRPEAIDNLEGYALYLIISARTGRQDMPIDIAEYFDHVEMAGALS